MRKCTSIVILTGAGVSAESGIPTFRAADGLWENHPVEQVATPEGFFRDPVLVHRFYNQRRQHLLSSSVKPNPAHAALAHLQKTFRGDLLLVTQNIDDLHERAGSKDVVHMHGELLRMRCLTSEERFDCRDDVCVERRCACCHQSGTLRPDIVWFGEVPMHMERISQALAQCDVFIAVGTSGHVYPAAGFVAEARQAGAHCIELNLENSAASAQFHEHILGKAGHQVPRLVEEILTHN